MERTRGGETADRSTAVFVIAASGRGLRPSRPTPRSFDGCGVAISRPSLPRCGTFGKVVVRSATARTGSPRSIWLRTDLLHCGYELVARVKRLHRKPADGL